MSKIKLVFATLLLFGIFTDVQASELKRLCGLKTPSFNPSPVCDEESGIVFHGGPNCDNQVLMSVYFANLAGFDVLPMPGVNYSLPTTMPDLYVQFDIDFDAIYEVTIPLPDSFYYHGVNLERTEYPAGTHYVYEYEMDITQYFNDFDPCPDDDAKTVSMRLVQQGSNGNYFLFDPLPYGDFDNIASCDVFHETCSLCANVPNCNSSSSFPQYDINVCVDCTTDCDDQRKDLAIMIDNQIARIDFAHVVSPNPFSDEVTIEFQTLKENTPTEIKIYDWTGTLVLTKSLSSDIGKRKITLDMRELPQGVYYLNLTTDEIRTTSKIIKL